MLSWLLSVPDYTASNNAMQVNVLKRSFWLTSLLICTGMSLDLGYWYVHRYFCAAAGF